MIEEKGEISVTKESLAEEQNLSKQEHLNESILNEEILEDMKKNRIDHMTYLPGMENIDSSLSRVIALVCTK